MIMIGNEIFKHWVHSSEEDKEGVMVFRPSHYNFLPSRGRQSIQIKENGEIIFSGPGKDDRKIQDIKFYELENPNILKVFSDDQRKEAVTKFEILECNSDVLKIRRI